MNNVRNKKRRRNRKYKKYRRYRKYKKYAVFLSLLTAICIFLIVNLNNIFNAYGENNAEAILEENSPSIEQKEKIQEKHIIDMKGLSQNNIPTGCESVSTVAVLRYYGVDITPYYFIDNYLPMESFYRKNGKVYGADPNEKFAGNPYEEGSLGCYSEVIEDACINMMQCNYEGTENLSAESIKGCSLSEFETYISQDKPVIIWVTIDMEESYDGFTYYLETGEKYVWKSREHCVVLCGYDDEKYYIMDPLKNGTIISCEKSLVEKRYTEMGMQAVVIEKEN